MKAILLDIEGTTTPIDFVHKVLFPYARTKVGEYVDTHWDELSDERRQLADEANAEGRVFDIGSEKDVSSYLTHLIDIDRKSTPVKSVQGKIWKAGYESGALTSVVFDDVVPAFECWTGGGKLIAIYSSGSVLAQKLLFAHTQSGDLTKHIGAYFDTTTGPKREKESYDKIAAAIKIEPKHIIFVSDIADELEAADAAGMECRLSIRPGNAPLKSDIPWPRITSLADI